MAGGGVEARADGVSTGTSQKTNAKTSTFYQVKQLKNDTKIFQFKAENGWDLGCPGGGPNFLVQYGTMPSSGRTNMGTGFDGIL